MCLSQKNDAFIMLHREEDVRKLALRKMPEGVDAQWCLQQIEGWQLARRKLPRWAMADRLCFPPRISMEQCSSEQTAHYKRDLVERLLPPAERHAMADMTGGFGIDFSYLAPLFQQAFYVEQQAHLCDIARHNFPLLGLHHAHIINAAFDGDFSIFSPSSSSSSSSLSSSLSSSSSLSLVFLDPARRDDVGSKVVALEDCTPNVVELLPILKRHCRYVVIKLSPMLDITLALRRLADVSEVHVVSVQGECKELLLVVDCQSDNSALPSYHCVNIKDGDTSQFVVSNEGVKASSAEPYSSLSDDWQGLYLYEPNASVLKAGVQDALSSRYPVRKLHLQSNLFVSDASLPDFPGRMFRIVSVGDFSKRSLKAQLQGVSQANLTVRNFPSTVAVLRKQLKLKEGGSDYLFATTLSDGRHALVRCEKTGA